MLRLSAALLLLPAPGVAAPAAPSPAPAQLWQGLRQAADMPECLLPLLALGLALGAQAGRLWALILAGLGAGLLVAPLTGEAVAVLALAAGIPAAALVALRPTGAPTALRAALALILPALAMTALFHASPAPPLLLALGAYLLAGLAITAAALLSRGLQHAAATPWGPIALRIGASWLTAILALLLAFSLRPL
ncbi:hypothetical protein KM176_08630 [Pseudooceanicola sp. CBS1P-1]|uniref:Uncharacterized protein n=1 Tax=Pseudooceanicola albus TaxID=2692189 RepID=A0A6L7FYA8_9RHOB|nr:MULTISPECIES: hypothetical protein [Pseudooceanicola]MBT9383918.1 hypothetical protein [Pseudooceanicola endophyticus]MXN16669.1 hypothetical protein [Pseudooceanicola albus]